VLIELDPVDRLTAGAIGPPGGRVFYLQARKDDRLITLLVEKQQVQLLAASVVEILSRVGKETGQGPDDEAMGLEEPILPEWRAGRLSIGYDDDRDLLMLEAEEVLPEEEEDDPESDVEGEGETSSEDLATLEERLGAEMATELDQVLEEASEAEGDGDTGLEGGEEAGLDPELDLTAADRGRVRLWATREQMLSLARHGAAVCAAGRPRCPLCGNPLDPEGHVCPALNGHRKQTDE
jgi:uncharacterized repeat protein (TIGR03847 family)